MSTVAFVTAVIVGLLLAETRVSKRHERQLRALGAVTPHGDVFVAMAVIYPAAFVLMGVEGLWRASAPGAPAAPGGAPSWFSAGVLLFAASKGLKYWAIRALGERWTFRVMVVPGWPLVHAGPYRYVAHPNYIAVVGELVGTAMMDGARIAGPLAVGIFGALLWARVRFEEQILRSLSTS